MVDESCIPDDLIDDLSTFLCDQTNVPNIRMQYRAETLNDELALIGRYSNVPPPQEHAVVADAPSVGQQGVKKPIYLHNDSDVVRSPLPFSRLGPLLTLCFLRFACSFRAQQRWPLPPLPHRALPLRPTCRPSWASAHRACRPLSLTARPPRP